MISVLIFIFLINSRCVLIPFMHFYYISINVTYLPAISEDTNSELSDSSPSTSSSTTSIGSQSPSSAGSFSSITVSSSSGGSGDPASQGTVQPDGIKIVGDNIDKHVKPREMRHDVQAQSLHYFNSYAVKDRLPTAQLEDKSSLPDFSSFDPSKLMPSTADDKLIQKNFTILISRVLKKNFPFFEKFATSVPKHIKHKFYKELSKKSEVVSKTHDHVVEFVSNHVHIMYMHTH